MKMRWRRGQRKRLNRKGIGVLLGIAFLCGTILNRCSGTTETHPEEPVDPVYRHDYDWDHLGMVNGFMTYESEAYTSLTGIDVSYAQGEINWAEVAGDGVKFAMIRTGYRGYETGLLHEDVTFRQNMTGAVANGISVGVYFSSQAITVSEAEEEARMVLSLIRSYPVTMPVGFDMEYSTDHDRIRRLSVEEKTEMAAAFSAVIKNAGYIPAVYGSDYWLRFEIRMEELQDLTQFWMAHYHVSRPSFPYVFQYWQYSRQGHIAGITGEVDINLAIVPRS